MREMFAVVLEVIFSFFLSEAMIVIAVTTLCSLSLGQDKLPSIITVFYPIVERLGLRANLPIYLS